MTRGHVISEQKMSVGPIDGQFLAAAAVAVDKDRSPMGRCSSIYRHPSPSDLYQYCQRHISDQHGADYCQWPAWKSQPDNNIQDATSSVFHPYASHPAAVYELLNKIQLLWIEHFQIWT